MTNASLASAVTGATLSRDYVQAIKRAPYLSHEDEIDCARRWRDHQDEDAKNTLVSSHLRVALRLAHSFSGYGVAIDELMAEGSLGLVRALKNYDPERGLRFVTYAQWWVKAALQDCVLREASKLKIITTQEHRTLFFKLGGLKARLGAFGGDLPDDIAETIANDTGIGINVVHEMNRRLQAVISLDAPATAWDDGGGATLLDSQADREPRPDELFMAAQQEENRKALVAYGMEGLKDRERDIIISRVLTESPLTLEDLGQKYGITRERIRQLEAKALRHMEVRIRNRAQDHSASRECVAA